MTCKELRARFQGDLFEAVNSLCESHAFAEHIAKCGECGGFVEEQKDLANYLLLLRAGAPALSSSLDASVLAQYRACTSERAQGAGIFSANRMLPFGAFRWAAAVACAVILVAAVLLFFFDQRSRVDRISTERQSLKIPQAPSNANSQGPGLPSVRKKPNSIARSAKQASPAIPVALSESWPSTGFQGLMYCDQLSCSGAMDVIRVQLPSAAVAFGPSSLETSEFVYADVLVGPDGIARGIRVVE